MKNTLEKSVLLGNGFNINFGGKAYTNQFIIKRIIFNANARKYDLLFDGGISGKEIASIFLNLATWANDISTGKYDNIISAEEAPILTDFKSRYCRKLQHYYEIGLEDWLFILHVSFLATPDLKAQWPSAKQGLERIMLDAIYNDGDIQTLHQTIGKSVKRWFAQYQNIFTLNYDNNVEDLTRRNVFHLHGDFRTPANSENPKTLLGYIRTQSGENIVIPDQFSHCFCNALFDYSGEHKYEIACAFEKGEKGLLALEQSGIPSEYFPAPIDQLLQTHRLHPDLEFGIHYHFEEFRNLKGELHIIGMSPNNDAHIFRLINESNVQKLIFYYYSEHEIKQKLPLHQPVEYKSAVELWKHLDALPKLYNCKYEIPDSPEIKRILKALNTLSGDPVSETDIQSDMNQIPQFQVDSLCKVVIQELTRQKETGAPTDENQLVHNFREISRIALRNGVLPSALFVHVVRNFASR